MFLVLFENLWELFRWFKMIKKKIIIRNINKWYFLYYFLVENIKYCYCCELVRNWLRLFSSFKKVLFLEYKKKIYFFKDVMYFKI